MNAPAFAESKAEKKPAREAKEKKAAQEVEKASKAAKEEKPEAAKASAEKKEPKAAAEKPEAKEAKPAPPAPPSHTVKREPFKIQVDLDGVFEAPAMAEIVLRPKEWQGLTVLESAAHGAKVKKGDVLVKLDMEKIDRALDDLRAELKLGEIALKQAQEQFALLEKTTPLDLEAVERAQRIAEEDRKYYKEVGRPLSLKSQEMHMKFARLSLEYEKEELAQLEKMYKADDLTEETETLVLKRQRDAVERGEWSLKNMEIQNEKFLKTELPRQDQQMDENHHRRTLQWNKERVELPRNLNKARLELEKAKIQAARAEEKLHKMLADREAMVVKAPADGTVYYGRCKSGKFGEAPVFAESLRRHGNLQPNQVFMTVVEAGPLFVRASVAEEQLHKVSNGVEGTAAPTANPDLKWDAEVEEVSAVPTSPGSFDARLSVSPDKPAKQVVAGMTCKIKLTPYEKSDAVVVPPKTVFSDPLDEEEKFVYLLDKNNKAEKHPVKIGKQTDKQVEIRKGLKEGDKILLEAPKEE
ncbi:MAG: HlyD family efflux transporter periplasmic adaptor subunit [Pirellulales bacterium]|nr:HlyD family efflux transporter periplasmic adaptor subunit [Pirellulales bacterium]